MTMVADGGSTDSRRLYALVTDQRRGGLNVGHLRAFLEEVDKVGLTDDVHVRVTDELAMEGGIHRVHVSAERTVAL